MGLGLTPRTSTLLHDTWDVLVGAGGAGRTCVSVGARVTRVAGAGGYGGAALRRIGVARAARAVRFRSSSNRRLVLARLAAVARCVDAYSLEFARHAIVARDIDARCCLEFARLAAVAAFRI